jgi:hypothetical protein
MAFVCQSAQHFQAIRVSSDPSRRGSHGNAKKRVLKTTISISGQRTTPTKTANPRSFSLGHSPLAGKKEGPLTPAKNGWTSWGSQVKTTIPQYGCSAKPLLATSPDV